MSTILTPARRYGWRNAPLPRRGVRHAAPPSGWSAALDVNLRNLCPPPRNQGREGSCTGQALAAACDFAVMRDVRDGLHHGPFMPFSPQWIYYHERAMEGRVSEDAGASLFDGLGVVSSQGIATEAAWPYSHGFRAAPPKEVDRNAAQARVVNAEILEPDADTIIATLQAGFPIVFGSTVFASFESDAVAKTGEVPMPRDGESIVGGHAMLCAGVFRTVHGFRVRVLNSWGAEWGDGGWCTFPLEYLTNPGITGERIAIRVVRVL